MKTLARFLAIAGLLSNLGVGLAQFVPSAEDELRSNGYEANESGLAEALRSSNKWAKIYALRVVRERKSSGLVHRAADLLQDRDPLVRVEAAKVLAQNKDRRAILVLEREISAVTDTNASLDAAEALANLGSPVGYLLVKDAFLSGDRAHQTHAARVLPKFDRFRKDGIDVVPLLLQGMDRARGAAETSSEPDSGTARLLFQWIAGGLVGLGDARAVSKLEEASTSPDKMIRLYAADKLQELRIKLEQPQNRSSSSD
jgi:HEAT repeat protein